MIAESEQNQDFTIQSVGSVPALKSIEAIFLYDPKDGHVVHIHHSVVLGGKKRAGRQLQHNAALDAARALGQSVDKLKRLHIPDFRPRNVLYRVDVKKRKLIEGPVLPAELLRGVKKTKAARKQR
jgi:hypothetical protein